MDFIPNNVKVLLDVRIYKQDKPGSNNSTGYGQGLGSGSSYGQGQGYGQGYGSNPSVARGIDSSFGSTPTETSLSKGLGSNNMFGGSVRQDIIPYRPNMTFQNLNTDTVLFDPLVKITDATIKSAGKYTQLQFLVPDQFNELILKMNRQSGNASKTFFYTKLDQGPIQTAILENNTITIKPSPIQNITDISLSTLMKSSLVYTRLNNASKVTQDKDEFKTEDKYTTFIKEKPNVTPTEYEKLTITNNQNLNHSTFTVNNKRYYSKTSLELLLDATKDGTVSNNMKLTMDNLFALNSKMFLDSSELSIYKQSQSNWLYNLSSNYDTLYKERFLFKHKLGSGYFDRLKYNIIRQLVEYYEKDASAKLDEYDADQERIKQKYTNNYAIVSSGVRKKIDDVFTLFLNEMNVKDFPSIDYLINYKEYLKKEYKNIVELDDKNIPVEIRFTSCPDFYIYSFKWDKIAHDQVNRPIVEQKIIEEKKEESKPIDDRIKTKIDHLKEKTDNVDNLETGMLQLINEIESKKLKPNSSDRTIQKQKYQLKINNLYSKYKENVATTIDLYDFLLKDLIDEGKPINVNIIDGLITNKILIGGTRSSSSVKKPVVKKAAVATALRKVAAAATPRKAAAAAATTTQKNINTKNTALILSPSPSPRRSVRIKTKKNQRHLINLSKTTKNINKGEVENDDDDDDDDDDNDDDDNNDDNDDEEDKEEEAVKIVVAKAAVAPAPVATPVAVATKTSTVAPVVAPVVASTPVASITNLFNQAVTVNIKKQITYIQSCFFLLIKLKNESLNAKYPPYITTEIDTNLRQILDLLKKILPIYIEIKKYDLMTTKIFYTVLEIASNKKLYDIEVTKFNIDLNEYKLLNNQKLIDFIPGNENIDTAVIQQLIVLLNKINTPSNEYLTQIIKIQEDKLNIKYAKDDALKELRKKYTDIKNTLDEEITEENEKISNDISKPDNSNESPTTRSQSKTYQQKQEDLVDLQIKNEEYKQKHQNTRRTNVKLIKGGASGRVVGNLTTRLHQYFNYYMDWQNKIGSTSSAFVPSKNIPTEIKVLDKENESADKHNFFSSIFTAIQTYNSNPKNSAQLIKDKDKDLTNFNTFLKKISDSMSNTSISDGQTLDDIYLTKLKSKVQTLMSKYNETDFRNMLTTGTPLQQALIQKYLPYKLKDTFSRTDDNIFTTNSDFNNEFIQGKYNIDEISSEPLIKLIKILFNINLIIIDNTTFQINTCKNLDDKTKFYIFLLKNKEDYYLITYKDISIYSESNFNINVSDLLELGVTSPPLFIYLYITNYCPSAYLTMFKTLYEAFLQGTNIQREIKSYKLNITNGITTINKNEFTSNTTSSLSSTNLSITKSTYCYYITITLDLYEGKLPFMQKQTMGCEIKRQNIITDFTELTGIKLLPSIAENKYLSLLPQDAAKPSWLTSITGFLNKTGLGPRLGLGLGPSADATNANPNKGKTTSTSAAALNNPKHGGTRRKIMLTYKRQHNIKNIRNVRNVKEIKARLSRKLHNITHKLFKI